MVAHQQRAESRRRLLRQIAERGPVPRIDLARHTGLSPATVTTITGDLLRGGLIEEVTRAARPDAGPRGRPRIDLKLAGPARLAAGLKVSDTSISLVLVDFEGQKQADHVSARAPGAHTPAALADAIRTGLQGLVAKVGKEIRDLSAIGVGLAGIVDARRGVVYWSPALADRNIDFGTVLSDHLALPAYIDNDANLVAMAERAFGLGRQRKDFLVVTIESGVGMGIVLDGQLYRGTRGCGAEFGHTKVHLDGAPCRCGQRGCLEAYVSDYALLREATHQGASGAVTRSVDALLSAAHAGDDTARAVVTSASKMFAMGLANLVNIFDPELVILAGEQMRSTHLYTDAVIAEMGKSTVKIDTPAPEVVVHKWDNQMWARGAAAYALEFVLDTAVEDLADR